MRRIAVINQKGGVGKTTTAVNLGAALARLGTRTLICDLDPQCNLTVHVDVDPAGEQPSVYELLRGEATLAQAVRPTREPNLWVLPSSVDLAGVELELVNVVGREVLLRDALEADTAAHGAPRWDVVLADCPPSLGLLSLNALVLCDEVLVPVQSEFFALQGLSKLTEIVDLVQRRLNPRLRLCGLLSCRHDSSTNLGRQVMDDIRAHFGDVLFRSAIRRNVKLAEAPSHGKTIFEYDPESRGAADYLELARELLAGAPAGAGAGTASQAKLAPAAAPPKATSSAPKAVNPAPTPESPARAAAVAKPRPAAARAPSPATAPPATAATRSEPKPAHVKRDKGRTETAGASAEAPAKASSPRSVAPAPPPAAAKPARKAPVAAAPPTPPSDPPVSAPKRAATAPRAAPSATNGHTQHEGARTRVLPASPEAAAPPPAPEALRAIAPPPPSKPATRKARPRPAAPDPPPQTASPEP